MKKLFKTLSFILMGSFAAASPALMLCSQQNAGSVEGAFIVIRTLCNTNERQITITDLQNLSTFIPSPVGVTNQSNNNTAIDNLAISVTNDYSLSAKNIVLQNIETMERIPGTSLTMNNQAINLLAGKTVAMKAQNSILQLDQNLKADAAKKITVDAGDEIMIKTGKASITLNKDGTIIIKGVNITLDGSGKINAKASNDVVLKGSTIVAN